MPVKPSGLITEKGRVQEIGGDGRQGAGLILQGGAKDYHLRGKNQH